MAAERFSRILGEDVDGIEKTLAEIEEQTAQSAGKTLGKL